MNRLYISLPERENDKLSLIPIGFPFICAYQSLRFTRARAIEKVIDCVSAFPDRYESYVRPTNRQRQVALTSNLTEYSSAKVSACFVSS